MDAGKLFETRSVTEVRDFNLELSLNVVKMRKELRNRLQGSYADILKVGKRIEELYGVFEEVDKGFMELCFNEGEYRISRLAEPAALTQVSAPAVDSNTENGCWVLLKLSEWALAISEFIREPTTIHFRRMVELFPSIADVAGEQYGEIVQQTCQRLEQFLEGPGTAQLTLQQLIDLYGVLERSVVFKFSHKAFESILDQLLVDHQKIMGGSPSAQTFSQRQEFLEALRLKLLKDAEDLLEQSKFSKKTSENQQFDPYALEQTPDSIFVQTIANYELGLSTPSRIKFGQCISKASSILRELRDLQADAGINKLRDRWISRIEDELRSVPGNTEATSGAVKELVNQRNNQRYQKYLENSLSQISV
ncbi:HGR089Cp [Eremothecium sinecaudum]|uniref:HGR089Cp n=1 Tax=Eremothecium sinecaudum TaxID=45286 RepID=A0A109V0J2_9SACH|nr:HGR089Cp [Eremothecium sinecaudum]AMD22428.1 HGR089Cp [Eremothecium sinecaudum]